MILYRPNFVADPDALFHTLQRQLKWERRDSTPRSEYYINTLGNIPYKYGRGAGVREYSPGPTCPAIHSLMHRFEDEFGVVFEVCFLNRYHNQSDHLGWHSDNSPEMDDARPIAIISLGVEREIWFRPNGHLTQTIKQKLENGSLCMMPKGMQDTHQHRIPKAGFQCGERISLTFRGYIKPT